jgi:hypothetical protein
MKQRVYGGDGGMGSNFQQKKLMNITIVVCVSLHLSNRKEMFDLPNSNFQNRAPPSNVDGVASENVINRLFFVDSKYSCVTQFLTFQSFLDNLFEEIFEGIVTIAWSQVC